MSSQCSMQNKVIFQTHSISIHFCVFVFLIHKTIAKHFSAQPVNSCDSIMGAIGGPCNGHLEVSHVTLIEASAVEQVNSSPWLWQTSAEPPGQKVLSAWRLQKTKIKHSQQFTLHHITSTSQDICGKIFKVKNLKGTNM